LNKNRFAMNSKCAQDETPYIHTIILSTTYSVLIPDNIAIRVVLQHKHKLGGNMHLFARDCDQNVHVKAD